MFRFFSLLIVNYQDKSNTRPNSGGAHLEHSEHGTQLIEAQHLHFGLSHNAKLNHSIIEVKVIQGRREGIPCNLEYAYLYHGRLREYFHNCIYLQSLLSSSAIEGFTGMPCLD